jgi:mRNA interferase RelE/StbE
VRWSIEITPTAQAMLASITDRRLQEKIRDRIDGLQNEPDKQGKALTGNLSGRRSLRAAGQRYRIIYQLEKNKVLVLILAIGIRREGSKKDIYQLAKKLVQLGLLDPQDD